RVAELGPVEAIFADAQHPYSQALLASRPSMDPERRRTQPPLTGDPPNPVNPPSGCRFRTRCAIAEPVCSTIVLELMPSATDPNHAVACLARVAGSGHSMAPRKAA